MSTINPTVLAILEEDGVPEATMDGSVIVVENENFRLVFAGTVTNTISHGNIQTSSPAKYAEVKQFIPVFKVKGNAHTAAFSAPKGSAMFNEPSSNTLSVNCTGAESNYGPPIHLNLIAMALCMAGNPSKPRDIKVVQCAISVNPKNFSLKDDEVKVDKVPLARRYRKHVETKHKSSTMPKCLLYLGGDDTTYVACAIYSAAKAIGTGVPTTELREYSMVLARVIVHMLMLADHPIVSGAGPSSSPPSSPATTTTTTSTTSTTSRTS